MRRILTMLFVSVFMLSLCPLHAQETETLVLIDTDMGKIKVKLFNDTPLHREAISTRKTLLWMRIWATEI